MGKRFLVLLLAVLLVLSAMPVTVNAEGEKNVELLFWVYSDVVMDRMGELMDKWSKDFIASDPDVKGITFVGKNDDELLTSLMAGVGLPDCFMASGRDLKKYRDAIDLLDLSPVFEDAAYKDGFYSDAINAISADGGMWALPFISYIPLIYRNLDVLKQAGIDPAEGIPTMDAFLEQLAKVKAAGIDATHSWTTGGYFCPGAIMASDGDSITPGVENGVTTIKPEQLVRTFETLSKLAPLGNSMANGDDVTSEAFKAGKLGFMLNGPWIEPGITASGVNYDVVLVPPYEAGGRTGGLQGWDLCYGVKSGDEVKDQATMRWLKYLGEAKQETEWAVYVGRPVLRKDSMADPGIQKLMIGSVSAKGLDGGMLQMDFGHSNVFWPSAMANVAPSIGDGSMTPEEAAQALIDEINGMYADAGE